MRRLRLSSIVVFCAIVFCALLAVPALAQSEAATTPRLWMSVLASTKSLIWLLIAAGFCYACSCVLASLFTKTHYPPNVARLSIWAGLMLWVLYVAFIQCRYVVATVLPLWFELSLIGLGIFFGLALWFTRNTALE